LATDAPQQLFAMREGAGRGTLTVRRSYDDAASITGHERQVMNGLIYLIGLIVVIMAILSFLGLH
jgi:hypothetical protein